MAKRKTRQRSTKTKHTKPQNINSKIISILLLIIFVLLIAIAFLIYLIDSKKIDESTTDISKIEKKVKKNIAQIKETSEDKLNTYVKNIEIKKDKFEEYTEDLYKEYVHDTPKEEKKERKKEKDKKIEDIQKNEISVFNKPLPIKSNKPKLAIVIDDVTTQYQINQLNNIGYKTTKSLMPPTPRHQESATIAKNLPFYMIHLPLEAQYFKNEEKNTLHTTDSYEKIEQRIAQIRKWYPNAKYTNNHTGSKFTSNEQAMDKLFKALKKHNFVFVDSRTTSKSVAKKMAKKYKMPYVVRNVFLDNEQNIPYIQNQLKKAIKIAKERGFAIAICHPHSVTIQALKESKHLLKDLELVYINQHPNLNN